MGCRYYKMKIHDPDPLANRRRVELVKKALGPGVRMMVDVNQKLDVVGNQRQAAVLEDLDLVWYEEPVIADDIAACAEVANSINIPVATGENNYTRYEFRELIERKAARYLMPDVCRANGFSETLDRRSPQPMACSCRCTSCTRSRRTWRGPAQRVLVGDRTARRRLRRAAKVRGLLAFRVPEHGGDSDRRDAGRHQKYRAP